jgi:hypothetical protein
MSLVSRYRNDATLRQATVKGRKPGAFSKFEASFSMKSQPDAASRMVAEVVTQLPVPSRLGMLRFERLNEASWALLFLDPNCERQFGLPAGAVRSGRLALRQPDGAGSALSTA